MKRLFTLLMAAAGSVACTHGSFEEQIEHPGGFTATIEGIDTKTSMDGPKVLWSSGDQVSVFAGMNINELYQVSKASAGKASASFNKVGSSEGFGSAIPTNVAFYPYSSDVELDWSGKASVYATIPATQTYAEGSFGQGDFPMMAVTQDTADKDFAFKNVCGVLKLQLTGSQTVRSIEFKGNDGEVISGDAVITSNHSGFPSIQMTGNGATVTLDCGEGVQLGSFPREFFIVLPPVTFSKGFTVTVTDTDGKTMEIATDKSQTISRSHILKMPAKEYGCSSSVDQPTRELCFTAEEAGSTVTLNKESPYDVPQEYSTDGELWHPYTFGTPITLAKVGDKVSFRKMTDGIAEWFNALGLTGVRAYKFAMSGKVAASGNVMSLIDKTCQSTKIPNGHCFAQLFEGCTSLTEAPELPATALAYECYEDMFAGCTSLSKAPALPATALAPHCYDGMFRDCTSLSVAPELPVTTLAYGCYSEMFSGCTSLREAPELPVTTLAESCYDGMFRNCTSLSEAPELPAATLGRFCYLSMFSGCTSLTEAPELPVEVLAEGCYMNMFRNCTSLGVAPVLPAKVLGDYSYSQMFENCTSLREAPELPAMVLAKGCYANMFVGCTSLSVALALPAKVLHDGCYSGMFVGCTSLSEAPELPATTLDRNCYSWMFHSCTSLTEAPELPATTLTYECYREMFAGCTSLKEVKCYATDISAFGATSIWLDNVSQSGTFYAAPSADWSRGKSGIPEGWDIRSLSE